MSETLVNYNPFIAPMPGFLKDLSVREAQEIFEALLDPRSMRLRELRLALDANGGPRVPLTFESASLASLGAWFKDHVDMRPVSPDELQQQQHSLPPWLQPFAHGFVVSQVITDQTLSLCYDIGLYFGETMRHYHPQLHWQLGTAPNADAQQPVLGPFPSKIVLPPVSLMHTLALKVAEGKDAGVELKAFFEIWSGMLKPPI